MTIIRIVEQFYYVISFSSFDSKFDTEYFSAVMFRLKFIKSLNKNVEHRVVRYYPPL